MVKARVKITGIVQGVGFRASACEQARALGLTGWVRNLPDQSVEAEVSGVRQPVDEFILWCRRGPRSARVKAVDVEWRASLERDDEYGSGFDIRF